MATSKKWAKLQKSHKSLADYYGSFGPEDMTMQAKANREWDLYKKALKNKHKAQKAEKRAADGPLILPK